MLELTPTHWMLACVGAFSVGFSKAGFSGISLLHVILFAIIFGPRESTGIVLPMLILGDLYAVMMFRAHSRWEYVARLLPPTAIGVVIGTGLMLCLSDIYFKPLVGSVILGLAILQILRMRNPKLYDHVPHQPWFVWSIGLLAGVTTMFANAAGPVMALYLLAVALPKFELTGTSAWFFLIVNCFKVPFSVYLGLIHANTLLINAILLPIILLGLLSGRWFVTRISQQWFDGFLLFFVIVAALRMIFIA